jgi:MSHA biogenesis protein MshM
MYYAHFGLKEPPFKITPNTEFFFNGSNRGAVLDALIYAVTSGEGIVKVVGEVGSGKTMLCRMLQSNLPDSVESIYLANPSVAPEDILHAIAFELGLKLPKNADKLKVMQTLQTYLLERHQAGKQVVIFVEEAQGMPLATLEEIRLLSNLETKHDKLLQMVLFGQPELDVNLNQSHIRQLRERITHSFNLSPLHTKEVADYLIFRLRAAGYFGPHLFSPRAIAKLAKASEGLVRRVNILADKALLAAFADNVYQVTPKHVQAAIADSEFGAEKARKAGKKWWLLGLLGVILAGVLLGYLVHYLQTSGFSWPTKRVMDVAKNSTQSSVKSTPKVVVAPPVTAPSEPTSPPQQNELVGEQIPAQPVEVAPATIETPVSAGAVADSATVATKNVVETTTPMPAVVESQAPDLLQTRLEASTAWMSTSGSETVTIQLLGTSDELQLTQQLTQLTQVVELDNLYVYKTKVSQRDFYTVVYGSFINRQEANNALKQLPVSLQKNRPHLRTVGGILAEINKNT